MERVVRVMVIVLCMITRSHGGRVIVSKERLGMYGGWGGGGADDSASGGGASSGSGAGASAGASSGSGVGGDKNQQQEQHFVVNDNDDDNGRANSISMSMYNSMQQQQQQQHFVVDIDDDDDGRMNSMSIYNSSMLEEEEEGFGSKEEVEVVKLPTFLEAPAFVNGVHCPSLPISSSSSPCYQDLPSISRSPPQIAMTLDQEYLRGTMAAISSIMHHSACPQNLFFHFLASDLQQLRGFSRLLRQTFPDLRFSVYHFDPSLVAHKISSSVRQALEQPLNYARTYLPQILPTCIKRVIYLDSDLIVLDDIAALWMTDLGPHPLGAPEYCHAHLSAYFTPDFWSDPAFPSAFERRIRPPCYFNTGVMVMDLDMWRRMGYTQSVERWMQVQKRKRIYELGSLPPFLLVFAGDVQPIEHRWNQHGLGGDNFNGSCRKLHPGPVSLLHWSGKGKPWVRLDNQTPCPLDRLWAPYDLLDSSTQKTT